ncbi:hypothetical protein [Metabacillus sp. RGM 3146]|uniref:hypothetical protein n=1 Tax=Metabacillus sp. RGM 3146 TaxID=3401092 RepID=UPI003B9B3B93
MNRSIPEEVKEIDSHSAFGNIRGAVKETNYIRFITDFGNRVTEILKMYVLTSNITFSAGTDFAKIIKAFGKLVGEPSENNASYGGNIHQFGFIKALFLNFHDPIYSPRNHWNGKNFKKRSPRLDLLRDKCLYKKQQSLRKQPFLNFAAHDPIYSPRNHWNSKNFKKRCP